MINKKQAKAISGAIGYQTAVFITVYYSTVMNNALAYTFVDYYSWLVILGIALSIILSLMSHEAITKTESLFDMIEPTGRLTAKIGLVVSIVEISLFISYDMIPLAVIWGVGEIAQLIMRRKVHETKWWVDNKLTAAMTTQDGEKISIDVNDFALIKKFVELNRIIEATQRIVESDEYDDAIIQEGKQELLRLRLEFAILLKEAAEKAD